MNYHKASDFIPRMLDIVGRYSTIVADDFKNYSKDTPA
jgi:hypothetical protein